MLYDHLHFSLPWALPFGGLIFSLAMLPLVSPIFWHNHIKLVLTGWMVAFISPMIWINGIQHTSLMVLSTLVHDYIPFMALITALFTLGGGIHISMRGKASPIMNAGFLGIGSLLANFIGTMGASMLLIRPIIALNKYRQYKTHVIIFFIFLVSNIGGILTPLGDPPLFLGFLNGIDFFWTVKNLMVPFLIFVSLVLFIFWCIDHYYFFHDPAVSDPAHVQGEAKIQLKGRINLIFLATAIAVIILESQINDQSLVSVLGVSINYLSLIRDVILFSIAFISWNLTPSKIHEANHFSWEPLIEVAIVFVGIFITVAPVIIMLKSGSAGPFGHLIHLLNPNDIPDAKLYFWLTGILSAFLDNAPTYLIFFNIAGGDVSYLMGPGAPLLAAISMGAVFMGALTYIGNAPNFIIKAIASRSHISMPGFLGYLLWSLGILFPIFLGFSLIWFD